VVIIVWGVTGPTFRFSDAWQLVINTSTTIVTFLMVFLIQSTQNRDSAAVQLKLDELIRALEDAAIISSTKSGPFQEFYAALLAKSIRPEMARLILARKIATIALIV
jgi:low affinity Fe/Cu permease